MSDRSDHARLVRRGDDAAARAVEPAVPLRPPPGLDVGVAVLLVVLLLWRVVAAARLRWLRDPHDHRRHDAPGLPGDGPGRDRHLRRRRPVGRGDDGARQLPVGAVDGGPGPRRLPRCSPSLVLAVTVALSTLTGVVITASGVPDIIVTLAASFFLAGLALFIIGGPGGGTSPDFQRIVAGQPRPTPGRRCCGSSARSLLVWLPLKRSRLGLAIYAVGQQPQGGVPVRRADRPDARRSPTRSAACSPASPASSSRPRPAEASRERRSAPTPRSTASPRWCSAAWP